MLKGQEGEDITFGPGVALYNIVLHAFANSRDKDAREPAEEILWQMKNPHQHSFSVAISTWACNGRLESGEHIQLLFDQICELDKFLQTQTFIKPYLMRGSLVHQKQGKKGSNAAISHDGQIQG